VILVVGSTGLVGGEVCRQLWAAGRPVRALVRQTSEPAKVAALRELGVETVEGDLRDPESLAKACEGVDAIVSTVSAMPFSYVAGRNDIETTDRHGMRHLIDAATAAGVRKFVYTSFSGNIDRPFPLRDAKRQVERWLMESGLDWTILRPSYFMEVWLTPAVGFDPANSRVTIYGGGTQPVSWISVKDVAAFAGSALDAQQASRATLEIGGVPLTPMEVVGIFETRLHKRIELMFMPTAALDEQEAAATDPMQRSFVALMRCLADGDAIELGRTRELIGRQPVTVEAYAAASAPVAGLV
jgi:uncharacterized protein YbjT (DUF2867 family)